MIKNFIFCLLLSISFYAFGGVTVTPGSTSVTGTVTVTDGAGAMTVDGTVAANISGSISNTSFDATQATPTNLKAQVFGDDTTQALDVDAAGQLQVDVLTMPTTTVTATNLDVQIGGSDSLTIGTFPDNEPINLNQIGGTAITTGNGVSGTGVQRVTIASDSTGTIAATQSGTWTDRVVGNAGGAFDAANNGTAPANVVVAGIQLRDTTTATAGTVGQVGSPVGSLDHVLYVRNAGPVTWSCGLTAVGTTLTQCQAAPGASLSLYVTDILTTSSTATSGLFTLRYGTGANCGTGTGNIFANSASATLANGANTLGQVVKTFQTPIKIPANNALCVLGVVTNTTNITINGFTAP